MKADKYHGNAARNYDRARMKDGTWAAENALIEKLVTKGPVLDVPFGTGRYVPVYEQKGLDYLGIDVSSDMLAVAKKKYPQANCRTGSIFDLPKGFQTAVCTRLLNWLYPDQLREAFEQMGQAAETLIFAARTGTDGDRRATATYTHSTNTLKQLIGGRLWEQHRIGPLKHGVYIMVKARRPVWSDVLAAFGGRPPDTVDRLVSDWSRYIGVKKPPVDPTTPLTVEWWTDDALKGLVGNLTGVVPGFKKTRAPRRTNGSMVAFKCDGKYGLIDGRHRAQFWQDKPGLYPMIVLEC